jgi:hypothetical protein
VRNGGAEEEKDAGTNAQELAGRQKRRGDNCLDTSNNPLCWSVEKG